MLTETYLGGRAEAVSVGILFGVHQCTWNLDLLGKSFKNTLPKWRFFMVMNPMGSQSVKNTSPYNKQMQGKDSFACHLFLPLPSLHQNDGLNPTA